MNRLRIVFDDKHRRAGVLPHPNAAAAALQRAGAPRIKRGNRNEKCCPSQLALTSTRAAQKSRQLCAKAADPGRCPSRGAGWRCRAGRNPGRSDLGPAAQFRYRCRSRRSISRFRLTSCAETRISPLSVNFKAFEMKFRRICEILPSSVNSGGMWPASSKIRSTDWFSSKGRSMPRKAANRFATSNSIGLGIQLCRLPLWPDPADRSPVREGPARLCGCNPTCCSCSGGQRPIGAIAQQAAQERQYRVQRRAELVAHVGQEFRLQFIGAAQVIGLFIQFGVERHHAAIGIFQLAIDAW